MSCRESGFRRRWRSARRRTGRPGRGRAFHHPGRPGRFGVNVHRRAISWLVPPQDPVGGHDGRDLPQDPSAESAPLHREASALVIGQPEAPPVSRIPRPATLRPNERRGGAMRDVELYRAILGLTPPWTSVLYDKGCLHASGRSGLRPG